MQRGEICRGAKRYACQANDERKKINKVKEKICSLNRNNSENMFSNTISRQEYSSIQEYFA